MAKIETGCSKCGSEDYDLLNPRTGEVLCGYCRNRWIIPALVQQTETEKFLAEQAKRPQVIVDNTTETDQQLMNIVSSVAQAATSGCFSRTIKIVMVVIIVIAVLTFIGTGLVFFNFFR
jgi:uncharacterized Zn finger protein (UPF0148 family)